MEMIQLKVYSIRAATHCNTLQHAATRCNTLQHTKSLLSSRGLIHVGHVCNAFFEEAARLETSRVADAATPFYHARRS